ncbi:hypothetical protein TNCV_3810621 [Trichonephila clavipes]|nr:hypothetical protein TNCV_3810621 [Trichonephila clavipes]
MKRNENVQRLPKEPHQLKYGVISVPQGSVRLVKKTQERKSSTCYLLITKGVTSSNPVPLKTLRLGLQRKVRALALITIRGVEVAANQGAASSGTILLLPFPIREEVPPFKCAANSGYLSRTEKPDVNSLWISRRLDPPLEKRKLLIDLHNRKLIDGVTNLSIKGEVATIQENNDLSTVNRASKYFNLLKLYPDLTKPNLVNRVVKHEVKAPHPNNWPTGLFEGKTTSPLIS